MGLMDFIKGEYIEIVEWTDDTRHTLTHRFADADKAIKNGAQLIVRESQIAQFVYLGQFGDTFGPGKHTLVTDNIPVLTRLRSWKYAFNSPFKADVYFLNTRLFTGNKWGTTNPVMMPDDDLGVVRVRAFGVYDFRIVEPRTFLREVAGSDHDFTVDEFIDVMRSRIVSAFSDAVAAAKIPVLQIASRYREIGEALLPVINPVIAAKYGIAALELHRRERVGAGRSRAGDRQAIEHGRRRRPQRVREISDGAGDGEGRRRRGDGHGARRRPFDGAADSAGAGGRRRRRAAVAGRCRSPSQRARARRARHHRIRASCPPRKSVRRIASSGRSWMRI